MKNYGYESYTAKEFDAIGNGGDDLSRTRAPWVRIGMFVIHLLLVIGIPAALILGEVFK